MHYTCSNCGHEGQDARLQVEEIQGWKELLSPELVEKLKTPYKKVSGNEPPCMFQTLFLATTQRLRFQDAMNGAVAAKDIELFRDRIVPVLNTVDANFQIIGHLAVPSVIELCQVDLTALRTVFTFVTVLLEDTEDFHRGLADLRDRLKKLGLQALLNEGACDTIEQTQR